jgi:calcineurin-like phosphoesterase family protein
MALLGAILVLGAMPVPAAAAKPRLALSRSAAEPGHRVVVAGHGFPDRARVRVGLGGRTLRRARTGPRGGFRLAFRVPYRAARAYRLRASSRGRSVRRRFRIRPGPAPPRLVAAGDIACRPGLPETATTCRQARTADLVESLAPDAVAVLGDSQDEHGELEDYQAVYEPTWGRFKAITHPALGNHEYEGVPERNEAPGYFAYFGSAAGHPSRGYYRWELANWTMLVLNSGAMRYTRGDGRPGDCWPVSCAKGSRQERWLRRQLNALPRHSCVLAYWHHPRFSSGFGGAHQPHREVGPLFDALYENGAELVLNGHAHNYERFESVDQAGHRDPRGVTQFVVGTGGNALHSETGRPLTSTLRTDRFGVLELTLGPTGWSSRFVAEDGGSLDEAAGRC